jgi:hypothetical protein
LRHGTESAAVGMLEIAGNADGCIAGAPIYGLHRRESRAQPPPVGSLHRLVRVRSVLRRYLHKDYFLCRLAVSCEPR